MAESDRPRDSDQEWRIGQYAVRERFVDGPLWVAHTALRQGSAGEERASIWMINPRLELVHGRTNQLVRQLSELSGHNRVGLVNVIAIGASRNGPYVITGDAAGETLEKRLLESSLPAADAVRIVLSVAGVLGEAHTQSKAVHGALDTSRILISERSPRVRLRELGWLEAVRVAGVVDAAAITAAIPRGAAPELADRSGSIGPATDQHALASIAYEILTGRRPADDLGERALPEERVTTHRPDLPGIVDTVLQTAWAPKPEDRYPSIFDFANSFRLAVLGAGAPDARLTASLWPRSESRSSPPAARQSNRPDPRSESPDENPIGNATEKDRAPAGDAAGPPVVPADPAPTRVEASERSSPGESAPQPIAAKRRPHIGLGATALIIAAVVGGGYTIVSRGATTTPAPPSPRTEALEPRSEIDPPAILDRPVAAVAEIETAREPVIVDALSPPATAASTPDTGLRLWRPSPEERAEALARIQSALPACTQQFGSFGRHARLDVSYDGRSGTAVLIQMHGPTWPRPALRECIENEVRSVRLAPFNEPRWTTAYALDVP